MLKTRIYVKGCFVNFLVIFGYKNQRIKELERFREIRKIED